MILFSGSVVCFGGPYLIVEGAEKSDSAVDGDSCMPELSGAVPCDALILRAVWSVGELQAVAGILCGSGWSKICPSVVETVVIDMVDVQTGREL